MFNVTHNWPTPTTATATATASANNKSNNCGTNNSNNAARKATTQTVAHNEFLSNCKIKICNQYSAQMCARCLSVSLYLCVCVCVCVVLCCWRCQCCRCRCCCCCSCWVYHAGAVVKGHYQLIAKCTMYDVQMMYIRLYHTLE